jgi:GNAT superfamily N-acetyltransferase
MITLRKPIGVSDFESIAVMAGRLARYHGEDLRPDPDDLMRDRGYFGAVIASEDGNDIGFALWYVAYNCQRASKSIVLQNLFVEEAFRRRRIGARIFAAVVDEAVRLGADVKVGAKSGNELATEFYAKVGCDLVDNSGVLLFTLSSQGMAAFAEWSQTALAGENATACHD